MDATCYCCPVCARAENEFCGGEWNSHGTCAVGFYCNEEITRSISECIQTESPSECVHRLAPKTANYLDGVTGITVDDRLFEFFYLRKSGICTKIEHNGQYQNISDNPKWHKTVPTCNHGVLAIFQHIFRGRGGWPNDHFILKTL